MNETDISLSGDYFEDVVLDALINSGRPVQHFFFAGRPIPLARQRSAVIKGKDGKQKIVAFSPKQNVFNKNRIYAECLAQNPKRWTPPYTVAIKFICEPLKTIREEYPTSPSHGDTDNMTKLVWDSLFAPVGKTIPIFQDDRYIINTLVFKRLPRPGEKVGIHFWMIK